jgi:hypothetical protein
MTIDQPTATLIAAAVAAVASVIVAVWGFFSRKWLDVRQAAAVNELNTKLEATKGDIQSGLESVRHELTRVRDFDQFVSQRISSRVDSLVASMIKISGTVAVLDRQEAFKGRVTDVEVEFLGNCASMELDVAWLHSATVIDTVLHQRCGDLLTAITKNWRSAMEQVAIDQNPQKYPAGTFDIDKFYGALYPLKRDVEELRGELVRAIVPQSLRRFIQS